jgi:phosphoribosylglycinamide formyltransferase-1
VIKLGVLISGRGSNLQALIDAFPGQIALVISNIPGAYGLERAERAGIPTQTIDHKAYPDRGTFEKVVTAALEESGVDLVCLAGFLRVLTETFVNHWQGRMINIHPSLLPEFPGLDTHARAIAAGAKFAGCTVHWVVPEVDAGKIILQAKVPILPDDTPETLAARVLKEEHRIYPEAVRLVAAGKA